MASARGSLNQSVFYDSGDERSGQLAGGLDFTRSYLSALTAQVARDPTQDGKRVIAVFTDMGACAMMENKWDAMDRLELSYLPPLLRSGMSAPGLDPENEKRRRMELPNLDEAAVVVAVRPTQAELPAMLELWKYASECNAPVVLVNPQLIQDRVIAAGNMMKEYNIVRSKIVPVFHLEQVELDPMDRKNV